MKKKAWMPNNADRVRVGWLVGPWFDLLFFANLTWPVILWCQWLGGFDTRAGLEFWQIYFVTTPHRWITLPLVFFDRERFRERRGAYWAVFVLIAASCLTVNLTTGHLTCLLAIDYVWNAWHFAAQHHGIYRIYGRVSQPRSVPGLAFEKWSLRLFLLYVILRVAGVTWTHTNWDSLLRALDWVMSGVPLMLLARDVFWLRGAAAGRRLYLVSVSLLYLSLLWSAHLRQPGLVLMLTTASALFHAIEYLSLVGWSVQRRRADSSSCADLLTSMARQWGFALTTFLVILGLGGWLANRHLMEAWLLLNVIAAFLHYAYDGMIWKSRPGAALQSMPE